MVSAEVATLIGRLQGAADVIKMRCQVSRDPLARLPIPPESEALLHAVRALRDVPLMRADVPAVAEAIEGVLEGLEFHREEVNDLLREVMDLHA